MKDIGIRKTWANFSLYIIIFKSGGKVLRSRELGLKSVALGKFWLLPNTENGPVQSDLYRRENLFSHSMTNEISM